MYVEYFLFVRIFIKYILCTNVKNVLQFKINME